jgi:hypothetical protein
VSQEKKSLTEIEGLVRARDYASLDAAFLALPKTRSLLTEHARYMVHHCKGSAYYNVEAAKKALDGLVSSDYDWAIIEKARNILQGQLYPRDAHAAEDLLVGIQSKNLSAAYYLAEIHAAGYLKDANGDPVYDLDEAVRLYDRVAKSDTRLSVSANIRLCNVLLMRGLSKGDEKVALYKRILALVENNVTGAEKLYINFLLREVEGVSMSEMQRRPMNESSLDRQEREERASAMRRATKEIQRLIDKEI